jgi:hypothetical protein
MVTISITDDTAFDKTSFKNIDELAFYLYEKFGYGNLQLLNEKELTPAQKNRMKLAVNKKKSDMFNI